jgi:hypothetical protein
VLCPVCRHSCEVRGKWEGSTDGYGSGGDYAVVKAQLDSAVVGEKQANDTAARLGAELVALRTERENMAKIAENACAERERWGNDLRKTRAELDEAMRQLGALMAKLNTPQTDQFTDAVQYEAAHQRERWGAEHDAGKTDADWFWLIGYLAGKAIRPGEEEKRLHRIVATAAACFNWFLARSGGDGRMRPGIAPPAGFEKEAGQ